MKLVSSLALLLSVSTVQVSAADNLYGSSYESQTAQTKQDQLWTQITADTTPNGWFNAVELGGIFLESMKPTMQWVGDEFEQGLFERKKYIHSVGNVGKVKFVAADDTPYTGVFKGADTGLIRLSCAAEPNPKKGPSGNFIPGFGLKLLRDGVPSANLVAMFSVDGQDSWNFFKNDFSNHIEAAEAFSLNVLAHKFAEATPYVQTVGLSDFGLYSQSGAKEQNPKFPWELIFHPTDSVNHLFPDNYAADFTDQLKTIPAGTTLYTVYALADPVASPNLIGEIVLESELTTSFFGDKHMFFKHEDIRDDLAYHPEWTTAVPTLPGIFSAAACPFQRMTQSAKKLMGL